MKPKDVLTLPNVEDIEVVTGPATCGECRHWFKRPLDPNNLGQVLGDCRESPPVGVPLTVPVQTPQGIGVQVVGFHASYPMLQPATPCCSKFTPNTLPIKKGAC